MEDTLREIAFWSVLGLGTAGLVALAGWTLLLALEFTWGQLRLGWRLAALATLKAPTRYYRLLANALEERQHAREELELARAQRPLFGPDMIGNLVGHLHQGVEVLEAEWPSPILEELAQVCIAMKWDRVVDDYGQVWEVDENDLTWTPIE